MVKRSLDVAVVLVGLLILTPLMAAIAVLIKLDSPGPVLHRGERVGLDGAHFGMLKFRSMVAGAAQMGPSITRGGDPRVTRIGRFLRRTKLDELPNLINVLKGEMSLVGPRPESPNWVARYTPEHWKTLSVRPGITGLAQARYRHEEELLAGADIESAYPAIMEAKLALSLYYVEHRSLALDLRILWETVVAVLKRS